MALTSSSTSAYNSTSTPTAFPVTPSSPLPAIISTLLIIGGIIGLAVAFAKLIDCAYERHIRQKEEEAEENPKERELMQQQLQILQFGVLQATKAEENHTVDAETYMRTQRRASEPLDDDTARQLASLWMFNVLSKMKTSISSGEGQPTETTENAKRIAQSKMSRAPPPMIPAEDNTFHKNTLVITPPYCPKLDTEMYPPSSLPQPYDSSVSIDMKTFIASELSSTPPSTSMSSLYSSNNSYNTNSTTNHQRQRDRK